VCVVEVDVMAVFSPGYRVKPAVPDHSRCLHQQITIQKLKEGGGGLLEVAVKIETRVDFGY